MCRQVWCIVLLKIVFFFEQCTTDFCLQGNRFDSSLSTTIEDLETDVELIYEDTEETVEGKLYRVSRFFEIKK